LPVPPAFSLSPFQILFRGRTTAAQNACISNLRQLDSAAQQWSIEHTNLATSSFFETNKAIDQHTPGDGVK
jgi:hypothetical protein